MIFFKKKKDSPIILTLLYDAYKRAREDGNKCFYHPVRETDKKIVENFCKKNHLYMTLDHSTNGNIFYKFII